MVAPYGAEQASLTTIPSVRQGAPWAGRGHYAPSIPAIRLGSLDLEPTHGGLQQMIVIARRGLGHEGGDFMLRQSSVPGGLAAVTKDGKGVSVLACQRDGDVGVFWGHRGRFLGQVTAPSGVRGAHSPVEFQWFAREERQARACSRMTA